LAAAGEGFLYLWKVTKKSSEGWEVEGSRHGDVKDFINTVSFSPDGKILAYGSGDRYSNLPGKLIVWDLENNKERRPPEVAAGAVTSLAFSRDGKKLAYWSARLVTHDSIPGDLKLLDLESGQPPSILQQHTGGVSSLAFSPDGETLASGGGDETVKLWDVKTGRERATLKGHRDRVIAVAFSPNGNLLATGSIDHTVRLWRTATDEQVVGFYEDLAKQEPGNVQWQIDLVLACWRMEGRERLGLGLKTLRGLESQSKLTPKQIGWIKMFENKLKK
jgi:WD40 repeat protein